jgi:RNA polymerase sigma factor (TIGR02999 family)
VSEPPNDITQLLVNWKKGDSHALEELTPLVYTELRRLAGVYLRRERRDHTLQSAALVNEAYLRLVDQKRVSWQNRVQFYSVAARLIRRILVDYARRHHALKRGGFAPRVSADEILAVSDESRQDEMDLALLDQALQRLEELDPQQTQIVELRFFAGMTVEATAEALCISPARVKRDWALAKAWLRREILENRLS